MVKEVIVAEELRFKVVLVELTETWTMPRSELVALPVKV